MGKQEVSQRKFDEMFKRVLEMDRQAPTAPPNSDFVDVLRGTQNSRYAFERTPDGAPGAYGDPWKEGVDVTPYGDMTEKKKKDINAMLINAFAHGSGYDQAAAHQSSADASMAQAGAAAVQAEALRKNAETTASAEKFARERILVEEKERNERSIRGGVAATAPVKKKIAKPGEPVDPNPYGLDLRPGQNESPFDVYLKHRPQ